MPPRIPKPEDLASLNPALTFTLTYPEVPETTTTILLVFHGLGDAEDNFTAFAKNVALPGVLAITIRGVSPLPPALLGLSDEEAAAGPTRHFHWGDDLTLSPSTGELDPDPGFARAEELVLGRLIREKLIGECGWDVSDILLFGFGQGGSLALGLASRLRNAERVVDVGDGSGDETQGTVFKGVISIGGPLPTSMVPTVSVRDKSLPPVLICHGRRSEFIDEEALDSLKREFADVREVKWTKADDGMPSCRDEMLPIMQFLGERLQSEFVL